MASDKKQYERAVEKWHIFHDSSNFSVPQEDGIVAVVSSNYLYNVIRNLEDDANDNQYREAVTLDENDWNQFNDEAIAISQRLGWIGINAEIVIDASFEDTVELIQDPEVTDIIFIGHGSLGGLFIEGASEDFLDWRQISEYSTHLKQGSVTQRHCGIMPRKFNLPLGTFLVSDITNVRAAKGIIFEPKGIETPDNQLITPVFVSNTPPPYHWIKSHFTQHSR